MCDGLIVRPCLQWQQADGGMRCSKLTHIREMTDVAGKCELAPLVRSPYQQSGKTNSQTQRPESANTYARPGPCDPQAARASREQFGTPPETKSRTNHGGSHARVWGSDGIAELHVITTRTPDTAVDPRVLVATLPGLNWGFQMGLFRKVLFFISTAAALRAPLFARPAIRVRTAVPWNITSRVIGTGRSCQLSGVAAGQTRPRRLLAPKPSASISLERGLTPSGDTSMCDQLLDNEQPRHGYRPASGTRVIAHTDVGGRCRPT